MTKEEIITDMCYTWRHDYGLDKKPDPSFMGLISAGMTDLERQSLYKQMEQLYNHHIQPLVDEINELRTSTGSSMVRAGVSKAQG